MTMLNVWRSNQPSSTVGNFDWFMKDFEKMAEEMDRWLTQSRNAQGSGFNIPACDIEEKEGGYLLSVDLPGVSEKDINIEIDKNVLTITAERNYEHESKEGKYHRIERQHGRFQRSFTLPEDVDYEHVEAQYENGVLRLALPKTEQSTARKITIGSNKEGGLFSKLLGHKTGPKAVENKAKAANG